MTDSIGLNYLRSAKNYIFVKMEDYLFNRKQKTY